MSNRSRRRQAAHETRRRRWLLVGGAVVVVLAAVIALIAGGGDESDTPTARQTGEPTVEGDTLPELDDPASDQAAGRPSPEAIGADFAGNTVSVGAGQGAGLVLFVAHWCPHCQAEVPRLVEWFDAGGLPDGASFTTVVTATDPDQPNYPPEDWLAEERWDRPVLIDDEEGTVADAFGVSGFPFFVALDARGTVVARASGELTIEQIEALLAAAGT